MNDPDPANGNALTVDTSYTYTVLDAVTSVTSGAQSRAYTYDGHGRLLTESRPEWRLANLVMQRRARWLLSRADELFLNQNDTSK